MKALINVQLPYGTNGALLHEVGEILYDEETKDLILYGSDGAEGDGPHIKLEDVEQNTADKVIAAINSDETIDLSEFSSSFVPTDAYLDEHDDEEDDWEDDDDMDDFRDEIDTFDQALAECFYHAFELQWANKIKVTDGLALCEAILYILNRTDNLKDLKGLEKKLEKHLLKEFPVKGKTVPACHGDVDKLELQYFHQVELAACEVYHNGRLLITSGTNFLHFCNNLAHEARILHPKNDPLSDEDMKHVAMIALAAFRIEDDELDGFGDEEE